MTRNQARLGALALAGIVALSVTSIRLGPLRAYSGGQLVETQWWAGGTALAGATMVALLVAVVLVVAALRRHSQTLARVALASVIVASLMSLGVTGVLVSVLAFFVLRNPLTAA